MQTDETKEIKTNTLHKVSKIIFNILIVLIVVTALIFTIIGLSSKDSKKIPSLFGQGYLTVVSYSMEADDDAINYNKDNNFPCAEGFTRGDILLVNTYTRADLQKMLDQGKHFEVGDVITFPAVINNVMSYNTHRIIEVIESSESYSYVTKGDNNDGKDLATVSHLSVLASYKSTIKSIGNVFIFLQTPVGFLVCIVLPLVILFAVELVNFIKIFKEYRKEKNPVIEGETVDQSQEELLKQIEELKKQLDNKKDE